MVNDSFRSEYGDFHPRNQTKDSSSWLSEVFVSGFWKKQVRLFDKTGKELVKVPLGWAALGVALALSLAPVLTVALFVAGYFLGAHVKLADQ